jgi:hypothetical protein
LQLIARLQVFEVNRLGRVRRQRRFWPNAGRRRGCSRSIGGSRRPTTATATASNDEPSQQDKYKSEKCLQGLPSHIDSLSFPFGSPNYA